MGYTYIRHIVPHEPAYFAYEFKKDEQRSVIIHRDSDSETTPETVMSGK